MKYVCKGRDGVLFVASEELAEVLAFGHAARLATNNGCWKVRLGTGNAFRWAATQHWRLLLLDGGQRLTQWWCGDAGWVPASPMPLDVYAALCFALGVPELMPCPEDDREAIQPGDERYYREPGTDR